MLDDNFEDSFPICTFRLSHNDDNLIVMKLFGLPGILTSSVSGIQRSKLVCSQENEDFNIQKGDSVGNKLNCL